MVIHQNDLWLYPKDHWNVLFIFFLLCLTTVPWSYSENISTFGALLQKPHIAPLLSVNIQLQVVVALFSQHPLRPVATGNSAQRRIKWKGAREPCSHGNTFLQSLSPQSLPDQRFTSVIPCLWNEMCANAFICANVRDFFLTCRFWFGISQNITSAVGCLSSTIKKQTSEYIGRIPRDNSCLPFDRQLLSAEKQASIRGKY